MREYEKSKHEMVENKAIEEEKQRLRVTTPEGHVDLSSSTSDEGILLSVTKESSTEELHFEREESAHKHDSEE